MGFFQSGGILNRRGFFGAKPFSPSDISGLQLWLDATTGLFDATSGGSEVTTDGSSVARWEDQSGNGRHATQTTSNNRPVLKTAVKNSKNVIRFDGSNDSFETASFSLPTSRTTFAALSSTNNSLQIIYEQTGNYNDNDFSSIFYIDSQTKFAHGFRKKNSPSDGYAAKEFSTRTSGAVLLSAFYNDTRTSLSLKQNNILLTGALIGTPQADVSGTGNHKLFLGARNQASLFFNGDIYELLIYNTSLGTSDESKVVDYLNTKWAIY